MLENRLEELRTEKRMTKKEVADYLQIDQSTYGKYELGKREPDYETLDKLASLFNVSVDYLLGRTNVRTPIETIAADHEDDEIFAAHSISNYENMPKDIKDQVRKYAEFLWKEHEEKKKGGK